MWCEWKKFDHKGDFLGEDISGEEEGREQKVKTKPGKEERVVGVGEWSPGELGRGTKWDIIKLSLDFVVCVDDHNGWMQWGKPSRKKSAVFWNIVQRGGVKPMFKNYVVNLVCTEGHSTTWNFHEKFTTWCSNERGGGGVKGFLNNVQKSCTLLAGWLPFWRISITSFHRNSKRL